MLTWGGDLRFMNTKKLVFLFVTPALVNDDKKYSLQKLVDRGLKVEIWDLTPAVMPDIEKTITQKRFYSPFIHYIRCENIRQIEDKIRMDQKAAFFFPMFDLYYEVRKIYGLFTKYHVRYGYVNNMVCEQDSLVDGFENNTDKRFQIQHIKHGLFNRVWKKIRKYTPAEFIAFGTNENEQGVVKRGVCSNNTLKLHLHTFDYERFMDVEPYEKGQPYCVFLDQYIPFHPDNLIDAGLKIDAKKYYDELNAILDCIQQKLNVKIIVAAHPRADYNDKKEYLKGYQIEYGKTSELIKGATLVVAHFSTAIGMVPLARVPVAIIDTELISRIRKFDVLCQRYAEALGAPIICKPQDVQKKVLQYDLRKYEDFVEKYMTCNLNMKESLWNEVVEYLEKT